MGWGIYTKEELVAMQGSEWYDILMTARVGDQFQFGDGKGNGPRGLGSFMVSGGKLTFGGSVGVWDSEVGDYKIQKTTSVRDLGDLFEQTSRKSDTYSIWRPRGADYVEVDVSVGLMAPKKMVGVAGSCSIDRYGNIYIGGGPSGGLPCGLPVSADIVAGKLYGGKPPESQLKSFMTGSALTVCGGAGPGMGVKSNAAGNSMEFGLYSPQFGSSDTWSFCLQDAIYNLFHLFP
jgi:hypothetical protein